MSNRYVATTGSDSGAGTLGDPWQTIGHAISASSSGDVIYLRAGTYTGVVTVDKSNITIQSYPGERATISAVTDDPAQGNVLYFTESNGQAINLDISGGYYYGIKFDQGPGMVDGCKVTSTGYFGIKIIPGADYITIRNTEVGYPGVVNNAGGIDDVNGDYLTIQDCYIHDTPTDALHIKGGAIGVVVERNRIVNSAGTGISVGQSTGVEFFDPGQNPNYYEIISPTVRNNIIQNTDYAGIAIYAAYQPVIENNTVLNAALVGQSALYLVPMNHTVDGNNITTVTLDPTIVNNIVSRSSSGSRPLFHIYDNGFTGTLTLDHNRYYNGGSSDQFWDERSGHSFYGNFSGWQSHISAESGSSLGDPGVDSTGHLVSGSACIDAGRTLTGVTDDIDHNTRSGSYDIGADEYVETGSVIEVFINAGGGTVSSFDADKDYSGGEAFSNTDTIDTSGVVNPAPAAVYQSERFRDSTYTIIGLTPGWNYTVRLHFAEIYWTSAGQRKFNVTINGTTVLANYDIYAAAGGKDKAVVEPFLATVDSNGHITIQFAGVVDQAKISAIEMYPNPQAVAINAGGSAVGMFTADGSYSGGTAFSVTDTVDTSGVVIGPAPAAVYQTERFGNTTYTITGLTSGWSYTVRLHFAEIYWTAANLRKFNVAINGTTVLSSFDIYATAGGKDKAITRQFVATADGSGHITIQFTGVVDQAKISAIEVILG